MSLIPREIYKFFSGVGKTLLVKGAPGVGKSIFSLTLLEKVSEEKNGIYISTRVNIDGLYDQFPWIESALPPHNIIDASTIDSTFMDGLYERIVDVDMDYPMVVIDSWDAVTDNLEEGRIKLDSEITSLARRTASHLVLVTERSTTANLDYLVDGVVSLNEVEIHGEALFGDVWRGGLESRDSREIRLEKLRGVEIEQKRYTYSLYRGGFQYFKPFLPEPILLDGSVIKDPDHQAISSGNDEFDQILKTGFLKGSFNLLEMEHGVDQRYSPVLASILSNTLRVGRGVVLFPIGGFTERFLEKYESDNLWRVKREYKEEKDSNVIPLDEDPHTTIERVFDLRESFPKKEFLYIIDLSLFEYNLGCEDAIKLIVEVIGRIRGDNDVLMCIVKRPQQMIDIISHDADRHLVFKDLNGSLCMYGMRPKTFIYNISLSNGKLKFTPIV